MQLADLAPRIQRLRHRQEQLHAARWELENLLSDRKVELADMETVKTCEIYLKIARWLRGNPLSRALSGK